MGGNKLVTYTYYSQMKLYLRQRSGKWKTFFVQVQVKKIARLQDNLENCQHSLKAANIKLRKVEENTNNLLRHLGPRSLITINLGPNTMHNTRANRKTDGSQCMHSTEIHRKYPFSTIKHMNVKY